MSLVKLADGTRIPQGEYIKVLEAELYILRTLAYDGHDLPKRQAIRTWWRDFTLAHGVDKFLDDKAMELARSVENSYYEKEQS